MPSTQVSEVQADESSIGTIVQFLVGDVASLIGLLLKGGHALRVWQFEKRNLRATSGDATAAVATLLVAEKKLRKDDVPPAARQQVLLILAAFAEAWARCQLYGFCPAGTQLQGIQEEFARRLGERWNAAIAPDHPDLPAQEQFLRRLTGDPLQTPYYRALWETLTDPLWETPLLALDRKLIFEQFFRLAYSTSLARYDGEEVRRYLGALQEQRVHAIRQLLVQDIAGWGARHVFGNVPHHEQLPDLPLGEMYVEPMAVLKNSKTREADDAPEPVLVSVSA